MAELVGKSGTMMSAVLESAGYIFQARLLDDLTEAFTGSLGGFIFLIGVVVALTAFAVKGSFKLAPWLIIGPPMFFAVILPRSGIPEAQWRFGQQVRNQGKVTQELRRLTGQGGAEIQVSKLFARYVHLVSESVQEIIRRINKVGTKADRTLIFRGDMLSQVYTARADNTAFFAFLHQAFFHGCRDLINAAALVENPEFTPTETAEARRLLGPGYVEFREYKGVQLNHHATAFIASLQGQNLGEDYDEMARRINRTGTTGYSCDEIWNLTRTGLLQIGTRRIAEIRRQAGAAEVPDAELMRDLDRALFGGTGDAASRFNRLSRVVSRYVLRNEILTEGFSGQMLHNRSDLGVNASVEVVDDNDLHRVEQARVSAMEWSEKTRMMSAAENLPYYQGLLLYFLAMSFPFFALMLVIPGKHAGFILWFVLWLWVKSWDIGLAVVALLDQLLFTLFSFHREARPAAHQNEALPDAFGLAMFSLKNMDPTFQLSTYYNILATCILSIPVISSQMILGSLTGGAGLVAAGMGMVAQTLAGAAQTAQQQTTVSELRFRLNDIKRARADAMNDLMWNRSISDPSQRARFDSAGRGPEAGRNRDYRADFMEFGGDMAERIEAARPEHRGALRQQLRTGAVGRGADGQALPPPRPVSATNTARSHSYPVGHTNTRIYNNPAVFDRQLRAFDQIANEMQRDRRLYEAMDQASKFGSMDWAAGIGPRAPGRAFLMANVQHAFQGLGAGKGFALTGFQQAVGELDIDSQVLYSWLMFNQNYSAEGQDLAGMARVWGMLEVPWTENSGAVEDDRYLQFLRRRSVHTEIAALNSVLDILDQGVNVSTAPQWPAIYAAVRDYIGGREGLTAEQRDNLYMSLNDPVIQRFFARETPENRDFVEWWKFRPNNPNEPDPMVPAPTMRGLFRMLYGAAPPTTPPPER